MNVLYDIKNMGFKITWKLISIGLTGFDKKERLLSYDDLLNYLIDILDKDQEKTNNTNNIIKLICEIDDGIVVDNLINDLSIDDNSIESIQCRKWKAYLLKNILM